MDPAAHILKKKNLDGLYSERFSIHPGRINSLFRLSHHPRPVRI
jgi:hypothetical protein